MTSTDMVDFLAHNAGLEHENPLPLTFLECGGFIWGPSSLAPVKICDITVRPAVVQRQSQNISQTIASVSLPWRQSEPYGRWWSGNRCQDDNPHTAQLCRAQLLIIMFCPAHSTKWFIKINCAWKRALEKTAKGIKTTIENTITLTKLTLRKPFSYCVGWMDGWQMIYCLLNHLSAGHLGGVIHTF